MMHTPSMTAGWQRARPGAGAFLRVTLLAFLLLSGLGGLAASAAPAHASYEWCDIC